MKRNLRYLIFRNVIGTTLEKFNTVPDTGTNVTYFMREFFYLY